MIDTGGPGGAETVLDTLVSGLVEADWPSRVLLREEGWLADRLASRGIDFRLVESDRGFDLPYLKRLVQEFKDYRPAVVHTHLLTSAVYGTVASEIAGQIPLVATFHGAPDIDLDSPMTPVKSKLLARPSNRLVYVSDVLRRSLSGHVGSSTRSCTIPNGLVFGSQRKPIDVRAELGLAGSDFFVLAVGNIRAPKDYPNLVRAIAHVHKSVGNLRVVVAGEGDNPLQDKLRDQIDALGLTDTVQLVGFRSDASQLMEACDLFVSSSASEGHPLATLEAVSLGKPFVLTRVGGVPGLVSDELEEQLVPPCDSVALGDAILDTLTRLDDVRGAAQSNAIRVRRAYSADTMMQRYVGLYRELRALYPVSGSEANGR